MKFTLEFGLVNIMQIPETYLRTIFERDKIYCIQYCTLHSTQYLPISSCVVIQCFPVLARQSVLCSGHFHVLCSSWSPHTPCFYSEVHLKCSFMYFVWTAATIAMTLLQPSPWGSGHCCTLLLYNYFYNFI